MVVKSARMLLAAVLAVCLVAGVAAAGEKIRVVASNNAWVTAMESLIPEFEKETGIKVELEKYYDDQLTQKITVEFAAGGNNMDVFMMRPLQEAKMFARNKWCEDLLPWAEKTPGYDMDDYTPASIQSTRIDGYQTCIPVMAECHMLYYRKDLYEEKGLKVPETFEELEANAKALTDRAAGKFGFTSRGQRNALVTQFSTYLYSFGGDFFDAKADKALVDTPEFKAATEYYGRMLKDYAPPGVLNMGWMQAMANFQQGTTAMYADASTQMPMLLDPKQSPFAEVTGFAMMPAGPAGRRIYDITPWAIAMSATGSKKEAAWKFISFVTDKKRTTHIQGEFASQCCRMSVNNDPEGIKNFPKQWSESVRETAQYGVGYDRPLVTAVQQARDIIGEPVTIAIEGKDFSAAQKRAQQLFQELLDREKAEREGK